MKGYTELNQLDYIEMGRRIRERREFMDLTREELAGQIGVSSKFIADIEYGEKGVSIKNLYFLTQVLDISADYILAGEGEVLDVDIEKDRMKEHIVKPLNNCNTNQLRCLEQIVKFYIEAVKQKE